MREEQRDALISLLWLVEKADRPQTEEVMVIKIGYFVGGMYRYSKNRLKDWMIVKIEQVFQIGEREILSYV